MELDELKLQITASLDVTAFMDILGIDLAYLVELLEDEIEEHKIELENAIR